MDFDVIVIGSGVGGLTAGSKLAKDGLKVAVFEEHFLAGGYATIFKRKGYNFDVSLHGIGGLDEGGSVRNIFKACGIDGKVKALRDENAYSLMINRELITIPNDREEYKKMLINRYKDEKKGIEKLFKDLDRFSNGFDRFVKQRDKSFLNKLHLDVALFISWSGKTTYEVLKEYTDNEELIRVFTGLWPYYGLPPKMLSSLYYFSPWLSYHNYGKYYIEGGSQALSNSFVEVIKENGGEVFLRTKVEKILEENGVIKGVRLKDGREVTSKWVISNASPLKTLEMLGEGKLEEEKKIKEDEIGCTLSQLYLGLDCDPEEIGIPKEEVFFFEGDSHEEDYELSINNQYEKCGFLLTNYNGMDPNLNEKGKGVLTITYIDNYDYWSTDRETYLKQKEEVKNIMIERVKKYYKDIDKHIVVAELGTPRTMERYTKNPRGAVYGYAQYKDQAGKNRLQSKTSIKNLSFVGAWIKPGGGYEGSISGGIVEALRVSKILKGK